MYLNNLYIAQLSNKTGKYYSRIHKIVILLLHCAKKISEKDRKNYINTYFH